MRRLLIDGGVGLVIIRLELQRPLGQLHHSLNVVDLDASSAPRSGGMPDIAAWQWRLPSGWPGPMGAN
jgi:hypothetical protein